jgi:phage terminase small subunit
MTTRARWFTKPTGLSDAAIAHWRRLGPALLADERLTAENAESFRSLCRLMALIECAAKDIEATGVTVTSPTGIVRQNPAIAALLQLEKQADGLFGQFGLR